MTIQCSIIVLFLNIVIKALKIVHLGMIKMKCEWCGRPLEEHKQDTPIGKMKVYVCKKAKLPTIISTTNVTCYLVGA